MRRGHDNGWLEEDGNLIGINLGSDFVAEHEWGTKDLREILGVSEDESILGIERRRMKNPQMDGVILVEENKNNAGLVVIHPWEVKYFAEMGLKKYSDLSFVGEKAELATAWSGRDLGIRVKRPVNIKKLKKIYKAIETKDAAIWIGGGGVFKNGGLCIGIISKIPDHCKQEMYDADLDRQKLMVASEATGIKAKLDAVNAEFRKQCGGRFSVDTPCGYYALSPAWIGQDKKQYSKYSVMYWLNPMEQKNNHYGWYTVEQLEMWVEGKGPIVEKKVS